MKRRLQKKYFKRVADDQRKGVETSHFYIDKVRDVFSEFYNRKYLTEFRPWWYERLGDWKDLNFSTELDRFYYATREEFGTMSGIDMNAFTDSVKAWRKQRRRVYGPKKLRRRKVKEEPIRKLKRPEQFHIALNGGELQEVTGERVFQHQGYHFFIYRTSDTFAHYVVTDVLTGVAVARSHRYKKAVEIARSRIEKNFDSYLKQIKKIKRQQLGGRRNE